MAAIALISMGIGFYLESQGKWILGIFFLSFGAGFLSANYY